MISISLSNIIIIALLGIIIGMMIGMSIARPH